MAKPQIEAKILKGFRDLLPSDAQSRMKLFDLIRGTFEEACYLPIDTPALEYTEILLGKGSDETDKQLFRFKDQGDRDVAMRFDLTVPLARFAAQHRNELNFPFRRYHIAPVWRAEKPQRGRFREFYQCDFDIIGTKDIGSDIETLNTISRVFEKISIPYRIRVNHRQILNAVIKHFAPEAQSTSVLRAIDKLEKLGQETVKKELVEEAKLNESSASRLLEFLLSLKTSTNQDIFKSIHRLIENDEEGKVALNSLSQTFEIIEDRNLKNGSYVFDITIARGLDYYTGIVFETQLTEFPDLGSVCSGGRYDNLATLFTTQELPGVGGSVGIDRLLVALQERAKEETFDQKILVTVFSSELIRESFKVADILRSSQIKTEVFPNITKVGNQLKYADKAGYSHAIIIGPDEAQNQVVQIKDLKSKEPKQYSVAFEDLVAHFSAHG